MGAAAAKFEAHGNPAGATFVRYGITQNHYRAMSSEVLDNPRLRGLMGDMADQLEADGCPEEAALLRDPLSAKEAREMDMAFSKLNEVFDSKKALAKKANGKTEVANSMLCDLYERVKSWEGPGAGLAALIARSKFGATHIDMTDKLFGEMRRLINLDEKAVEEELRKLGVTLDFWVDPAAAKSKKTTKRKSREVIEIPDSSSDEEDEKPSPTKKAKAAPAPAPADVAPAQAARNTALNGTAYTGRRPGHVYTTRNGVTGYYADAAAATAAADPEEDAELICRPRTKGKKS